MTEYYDDPYNEQEEPKHISEILNKQEELFGFRGDPERTAATEQRDRESEAAGLVAEHQAISDELAGQAPSEQTAEEIRQIGRAQDEMRMDEIERRQRGNTPSE